MTVTSEEAAAVTEPCPSCGRTDGKHTPTKAERGLLRRVAWRAFWRGFRDPFGLRSPTSDKGESA